MVDTNKLDVAREPSCSVTKDETVVEQTECIDKKRIKDNTTKTNEKSGRSKIISMVFTLRDDPQVFWTTIFTSPESLRSSIEAELAIRKYFINVLKVVLTLNIMTIFLSTMSLFMPSIEEFLTSLTGLVLTVIAGMAYVLIDHSLTCSLPLTLRKSPFSWIVLCASFVCYNTVIAFCTTYFATTALICTFLSNALFISTCLGLAVFTKYDFKSLSLYGIALLVSVMAWPISYFGSSAVDVPFSALFLILFMSYNVLSSIWIANDIHLLLKEEIIELDLKALVIPSLILYTSINSSFLLTLAMKQLSKVNKVPL